jgi:hypothetical protein
MEDVAAGCPTLAFRSREEIKFMVLTGLRRIAAVGMIVVAALGTAAGPASAGPKTARAAASPSCYVSNQHLYCSNVRHTPMYEHRSYNSAVVEYLESSFSYFECWGYGDTHAGGNNVWYWTQGDVVAHWGNVPASVVWTPYDPPAGMKQC